MNTNVIQVKVKNDSSGTRLKIGEDEIYITEKLSPLKIKELKEIKFRETTYEDFVESAKNGEINSLFILIGKRKEKKVFLIGVWCLPPFYILEKNVSYIRFFAQELEDEGEISVSWMIVNRKKGKEVLKVLNKEYGLQITKIYKEES